LLGPQALDLDNLSDQRFELLLGARVAIQRGCAELAQHGLKGIEK
jgi:hypothetical protein